MFSRGKFFLVCTPNGIYHVVAWDELDDYVAVGAEIVGWGQAPNRVEARKLLLRTK